MAHTTIKVQCVDQTLQATSRPTIASGGIDENVVEFSFCELWDGFTKVAVFYQDIDLPYYAALDASDSCVIPWEVLQTDGTLYIGVFGTNADAVTRTTELLRYKIAKGAITEGLVPSDPTPELWEQILAQVAATNSGVQALAQNSQAMGQAIQGLQDKHNALDAEVQELAERVDGMGGGESGGGTLYVTVSNLQDLGGMVLGTPSHTSQQIYEAHQGGCCVMAVADHNEPDLGGVMSMCVPLALASADTAVFTLLIPPNKNYTIMVSGGDAIVMDDPLVMTGATSSAAGTGGHVPTPSAGQQNAVLCGDGTWKNVHKTSTATLNKASWSNNTLTVSVSGVTASNTVIVSPAPASHEAYATAGVYCSAQASGKLTFTCKNVPSAALTVNVIVLGV